MEVKITITTGKGKGGNPVSHSKTIKDVATMDQVIEEFNSEFKQFFPNQTILTQQKRSRKDE